MSYPIIQKPSPNYNDRKDGKKPEYIIMHYTGMKTASEAIDRLCDPVAQVSAHYLIEEDGKTWQLVDEGKRAWHAGVSYWRGEADMNSVSIGIELVNKGHEWGYEPFPKAQINALIPLSQAIMQRHTIPPQNVIGHSDIAPSRKIDPGELFPWQALAKRGIGIWPEGANAEAEEQEISPQEALNALRTIGYNLNESNEILWQAFHRHFYPERLGQEPDSQSFARALALIRPKTTSAARQSFGESMRSE